MITYKTGDILTETAEAVVNTVNCVGVMGRGIALQFKRAFPDNVKAYAARCNRNQIRPGQVYVFDRSTIVPPRYIINFPTKRHWRGKSRIEDIESGLKSLVQEICSRRIRSIAIPPLGSGLCGLDWGTVRMRMEAFLADLEEVEIVVYEPGGGPAEGLTNRSRDVPTMTPGRAALVALLDRYLLGLLDPFVTLLEAHKLMYFMQAAGEPLWLRFTKGPYGPYAENLRHVLHAIEGHFVSGYADGGTVPGRELQLVPGALEDAHELLADKADTRRRFESVADLVAGFESSFGLELLSTVHWTANEVGTDNLDDLVRNTHEWNEAKKRFSSRQVRIAHDALSDKGWLT